VIPSYDYFPNREVSKLLARTSRPYSTPLVEYVKLKKKYSKHPLTYTDAHTPRVFRDGLAVEVNTNPTNCRAFMYNGVRYALLLAEPWKRASKTRVYTARPWVEVSKKLMAGFPDDLKVLGCSPSLDAYEEREKTVGVDPLKTFYRTCGSHLHMSFLAGGQPPAEQWAPFIKLADLLIGIPHTYIFADELEFKRRKLYGQAGEFRAQNYTENSKGLEYRVLSSRLWNHPAISSLFLGIWKFAFGNPMIMNSLWRSYEPAWGDDIRLAINEGDPKALEAMLVKTCELLPLMSSIYGLNISRRPETLLHMFKTLRKFNLEGKFPDAGIINNLSFGDGHIGFLDYMNRWALEMQCPLS
jgi:hypothetical protein